MKTISIKTQSITVTQHNEQLTLALSKIDIQHDTKNNVHSTVTLSITDTQNYDP